MQIALEKKELAVSRSVQPRTISDLNFDNTVCRGRRAALNGDGLPHKRRECSDKLVLSFLLRAFAVSLGQGQRSKQYTQQ